MTFAVKDNIDAAGTPTTAACPAYAYTPAVTAPAVQRLVDAGAKARVAASVVAELTGAGANELYRAVATSP